MIENYLSEFKSERTHDHNLIYLMEELKSCEKESLFNDFILRVQEGIGNFIFGRTKQAFDVLLVFEKANVVIETKVDSGEGFYEGWWQTAKIHQNYHNAWPDKRTYFLYLTYGLTEYHIKEREDGNFSNGPYSTNFTHVKCHEIVNFVQEALKVIQPNMKLEVWSKWLEFEVQKEKDNEEYLFHLSKIIEKYKSGLGLTDYPIKRLNLFTPEFAIPLFFKLGTAWNQTNNENIGRACLYSLGRGYSPVYDSILNFAELYHKKNSLTCGGIINDNERYIYFEFNEDFNLHLKVSADVPRIEDVKAFVKKNKLGLTLNGKYNGIEEHFRQGSYVVFEWDFNLLTKKVEEVIPELKEVLENAIMILD